MAQHFKNVYDLEECAVLLDEINNIINTLFKLSDTEYYFDKILAGDIMPGADEVLSKMGVDSEYFTNLAFEFQTIRAAVFGQCVDWDSIAKEELKQIKWDSTAKEELERIKDKGEE